MRTHFQGLTLLSSLLLCSVVNLSQTPAIATASPELGPKLAQAATPVVNEQADQLLKQGATAFQERRWEAAETAWQQALQLYRTTGNRQGEGRVLGNLAAIQDALGNTSKVLELFQASLAIAQELKDNRGEIFARSNLAYAYRNQGNFKAAIAELQLALPLAQQSQDTESEFEILNQLGIGYRALGQYEAAIAQLQQSLTLARQQNNAQGVANSLGNLANTYTEQGNYPAALEHYNQTLELMRSLQNTVGEATVLQRLGSLYANLGNRLEAAKRFAQSLALARQLGDRRLEAYNLGNLGRAYFNTDKPEAGIQSLEQALSIMQALGDRAGQSTLQLSLGNAYVALKQYDRAQLAYETSLTLKRELGDRPGEGQTLGAQAILLELTRQPKAAIARYREAIQILRAIGDRPSEGTALSNLGMALYDAGQLEPAAQTLLEAIAIWESLRPGLSDGDQVSLFETQAATYRTLQRVLIDLKRHGEALEIAERSRARAFVELIAQRLSVQQAKSFQTPPPTLKEIQAIARQQKATLVTYSQLTDTQLAVWVITPDGTVHFRESALDTNDISIEEKAEATRLGAVLGRGRSPNPTNLLGATVQATRAAITTPNPNPGTAQPNPASTPESAERLWNRKLRSMYQFLIMPIADLLPTNPETHVIFIPQGTLLLVPFAALQDDQGTFLIERHTLRTAPSIQVLALTHAQEQQRRAAAQATQLVVGNPTMPTVGQAPAPLDPLPFAEKEAIAIASLLKTKAVTGAQATETAIKQQLPTARLIHLATHGLLDDIGGAGIPGALALAPAPGEDGLLTASEILNLSLPHAELVVLSACDTGLGRVTGDGVIGLSRSFIAAGTPSIIVSLWAVPDDATALLMTTFYETLQRTPDKAQALRQAMLTTLEQYPRPRDWAAFTLVGETIFHQP